MAYFHKEIKKDYEKVCKKNDASIKSLYLLLKLSGRNTETMPKR